MKPKVLKNKSEYEAALEYIEELMDAEPDSPEEEELELFSVLIEQYEEKNFPVDLPDPVEAIKFRMDQEGLKQKDLIPYFGSASRVSEILNRKRGLSLSMIRDLHKGLGIPYEILIQEKGREYECRKFEISDFPFNEMYNKGFFPEFKGTLSEAKYYFEELLEKFFSGFKEFEKGHIYCRKNKKNFSLNALKAWQWKVFKIAESEKIGKYKKEKIDKNFLKEISVLSQFNDGPKLAKEKLNRKGIHLIILPHLEKTYLDGACFSGPDGKPVIGMTLRHDRLDNFWFTLLHELSHLLLHLDNDSSAFFDDTESTKQDNNQSETEKEADSLANNVLISRENLNNIKSKVDKNPKSSIVKQAAEDLNISPAIVAGRLRFELNNYTVFSNLLGSGKLKKIFAQKEL